MNLFDLRLNNIPVLIFNVILGTISVRTMTFFPPKTFKAD